VLAGYDLFYTLTDAFKWADVSDALIADTSTGIGLVAFVAPGTVPKFEPLGDDELIRVRFVDPVFSTSTQVSTDAPGTLEIVTDFDGLVSQDGDGIANNASSNGYDRDLKYFFGTAPATSPADTLYVLESVLSTNAPGIEDSEPIYTIFSPDGMGPAQRLHFAALYAEEWLGTPVPEPGAMVGLVLGLTLLGSRRKA